MSAWLTSSWRSRARRRRSSSWARMASCPSGALLLDALEQAVEGARQPVDLLDGVGAAQLERRARRGRSTRSRRSGARAAGTGAGASTGSCTASGRSSAMIMNSQRSLVEPRSSPAATLAASSVSANSTTLAATIWPMRESSRRVMRGLSIDPTPIREKWGLHPISARATAETVGEASIRQECCPGASAEKLGLGLRRGAHRAPRLYLQK